MTFDWLRFCVDNKIHFVDSGHNTKRGNINIKCPYCGASDPSEHMGLSLNKRNPVWGCWRNGKHRGKNPAVLVARLLHCSIQRAEQVVGEGLSTADDDGFRQALDYLKYGGSDRKFFQEESISEMQLPKEFRPIRIKDPMAARFAEYLRGRGYQDPYAFAAYADLYYSLIGEQAFRVIFPVYGRDEEVLCWTGRDITGSSNLRYKALDAKKSVRPIDECLWNEDLVEGGGKLLVVTEGPFDAANLGYLYPDPEMVPTCVFGKIKEAQKKLLLDYAKWFDRVVVLLDRDAHEEGFLLAQELNELYGEKKKFWSHVLEDEKDPGSLSECGVKALFTTLMSF